MTQDNPRLPATLRAPTGVGSSDFVERPYHGCGCCGSICCCRCFSLARSAARMNPGIAMSINKIIAPLMHTPATARPKMPFLPCFFVATSATTPNTKPARMSSVQVAPRTIMPLRLPRTGWLPTILMPMLTKGARRLNKAACLEKELVGGAVGINGGGDWILGGGVGVFIVWRKQLTPEASDRRREGRWSAQGTRELQPGVERKTGAAVRSSTRL